jgi:hypothetical protein
MLELRSQEGWQAAFIGQLSLDISQLSFEKASARLIAWKEVSK